MDRMMVYPGAIPLETDILRTERHALIALGAIGSALFGPATTANGLGISPTTPASMSVQVAPGQVYSLQNLDSTAYSSLAADTTHQIVKQGINLDPVTLACAAPTTAGYSVNYLIQGAFQETDVDAVVLPYYNASDPTAAYSGPANSGSAQPTRRHGAVVLTAKPGVAAASGTQATPSPDTGYIALGVVTVPYGATTIGPGNISAAPNAPVLPTGGLLNAVQSGQLVYANDAGAVNALAANILPAPTATPAGMVIAVKVGATNTGPATLNLNGLGAKSVVYAGVTVAPGMLRAGQIYKFAYDGASWQVLNPTTAGVSLYADYTSAGSFTATVPAWSSHAEIEMIGGGGAGGGCGSGFSGGGGGAGGYSRGSVAVTPGATLAITVGAGGTGTSAVGNNGGTTSITGIASVGGGMGGSASTTTAAGGTGGAAANAGLRNFTGGVGGDGDSQNAAVPGGNGASGPFGGGGRTGAGGGISGPTPGSGGGGAWLSAGNGGAGHDGAVYITFRP